MGDILGNSISGLMAFQRQLDITSHNIANVNTPGYTRQSASLSSRSPELVGNGYIGSGVNVNTVRRHYDAFLDSEVQRFTSATNQSAAYNQVARDIDNLLADPQASVAPNIESFFASLQALTNDPSSIPNRQLVMTEGELLAAQFNRIQDRFDSAQANIESQTKSGVNEISAMAQEIAHLNQNIVRSAGQSQGAVPNDLLDQRNQLITELSRHVEVTTTQEKGSINVFIGNGQPLVIGSTASTFSTRASQSDPTDFEIVLESAAGSFDVTKFVNGGKVGGLRSAQSEIITDGRNLMGRMAVGITESFNQLHRLGLDLDGNSGQNFFDAISPTITANNGNSSGGGITATFDDPSQLEATDYELSYDGSAYQLTRQSDQQTFALTAGTPTVIDGIEFTAAGGDTSGNRYLIQPYRSAARGVALNLTDPRGIAAASQVLAGNPTTNSGTGKLSQPTLVNQATADANAQQNVTITFTSATTFDVSGTGTGNPTGQTYTANSTLTYNGWQAKLTGAPATGDVFTITPNTSISGDNSNAVSLTSLQTDRILNNGTSTFAADYGQLVAKIGTRTRSSEIANEAQQKTLDSVTFQRDAVSGVNLDEEAANLIKFQLAYQASARAISIANQSFQSLLSAFG